MPDREIELNPVDHVTIDAIGAPGQRVFYLQAWKGSQTLTLLVEKYQVQSMAMGVEQFLNELTSRFPDLDEPSLDYEEEKMRIQPPVDPLFRVGELGLAYDIDKDLVGLIIREMLIGEKDPEDLREVRLYCSRSQLRALGNWGLEVSSRGRPICPYCNEPMDSEGHICPKKNGRNH